MRRYWAIWLLSWVLRISAIIYLIIGVILSSGLLLNASPSDQLTIPTLPPPPTFSPLPSPPQLTVPPIFSQPSPQFLSQLGAFAGLVSLLWVVFSSLVIYASGQLLILLMDMTDYQKKTVSLLVAHRTAGGGQQQVKPFSEWKFGDPY